MKLTYLFHSGFVAEFESCFLVFDYWMDPAGVMSRVLESAKPVYVLVSHFHEDHFNREIFRWKEHKPDITYILSKDVLKRRRAKKEEADVWLAKGGTWMQESVAGGGLRVYATGSNDSGVSWIVEVEGMRLFHAGDLNNWYARFLTEDEPGGPVYSPEFGIEADPVREEKCFLGELKDIRKIASEFTVVMFPIDGRIGNGYTRGGRQFLDIFRTAWFVPMHFTASGFESAWRMKEFAEAKGANFWSITAEGETLNLQTPRRMSE